MKRLGAVCVLLQMREMNIEMYEKPYEHLLSGLREYYALYENGLKKQANKYIEDFAAEVCTWDQPSQERAMEQLSRELCDGGEVDFLRRRGNGDVPYALSQLLREQLYSQCLEGKMPHMRWFYELYKNTPFYDDAMNMLENAYAHEYCDEKTVVLYFEIWLSRLSYGAHHFPEGCCISEQERRDAIGHCERIIAERVVPAEMAAELEYFRRLYDCYDRFCADGKTGAFHEYCAAAGIGFNETPTFYYEG